MSRENANIALKDIKAIRKNNKAVKVCINKIRLGFSFMHKAITYRSQLLHHKTIRDRN